MGLRNCRGGGGVNKKEDCNSVQSPIALPRELSTQVFMLMTNGSNPSIQAVNEGQTTGYQICPESCKIFLALRIWKCKCFIMLTESIGLASYCG